jgi:ubiquitin-like protein Pup
MAEQEQKRKSPAADRSTETEVEADLAEATPATSERGEKIKAELDDLLDEIDEVLEDNAEEFVRNYVQKGGQ